MKNQFKLGLLFVPSLIVGAACAAPVTIAHHNSIIHSVELALPARTSANQFNVMDFGAKADGRTLDRKAIQDAIDTASRKGGGYVVVPEGKYLVGGIILRSNVYLDLKEHAELVASGDPEDFKVWHGQPTQHWDEGKYKKGVEPGYHWNVVSGHNIENAGIIGKGVINGMGNEKYVEFYSSHDDRFEPRTWTVDDCRGECRPELVRFNNSKNLYFEDVSFVNSPRWIFHLKGSENIYIDGITVDGDLRMPNNDGIDIDSSRNITIRNSYISVADDGICLKSSDGYGIIDNLLVEDTVIRSKSSAIKVGSNVDEDMKNAYFRNIRIFDSNRGIGVQQVGYVGGGDVYDFTYENIDIETRYHADRWWGNGEPVWMISIPRTENAEVGRIYNIHLKDITAVSEHGVVLVGREGAPIDNVHFDNVHVQYDLWSQYRWPFREYTAGTTHPQGEKVVDGVDGIYIEHGKNIHFTDSSVSFHELAADYYRDCHRDTLSQNVSYKGLGCEQIPAALNWKARSRPLSKVVGQ
ncbi:glycosyl hydrolase family 28 protein [Aestuariibacter sp. A3R04]|uniref:glycoside hydrolase family 28 protein n=1 Tax=Aestuariibacter sp. A3R04 TaxID=2841571 RepID=UPI001C0982F6|nr:right-handed parallel beta-helix repeat-containing protein [Aestuariibacter sp. A3R04]